MPNFVRATSPLWLLALFAGCDQGSSTPDGSIDGLHPADPGEDGSSGNNGNGGDGTGTDTDGTDTDSPGGGGDTPGDTGDSGEAPPPPTPLRFVALGDAGQGNDTQFAVGRAIASVCATNGCDFALYLGDNFYSDGVSGVDDSQFQDKFEAPYAALNFPFHAVAGNHDYGGGGGGFDEYRVQAEVDYTSHSEKWQMPGAYYTFSQGDATFFALDSTALDWGKTDEQAAWLPGELSAATTTWKFAYGHHPYLSNGSHGNANNNFGPFFESYLCGQVDVYFSGHDHDLQWLESTCPGTEFIVSGGGGAGTYGLGGSNPSYFEAESNGFLWVEIDGRSLTGVFYDQDGQELFRKTITK